MGTQVGSCQFHDSMLKQLQNVICRVHDDVVAIDLQINACLPVIQPPPGFPTPLFHSAPDYHYPANRPDSQAKGLICTQLSNLQQLIYFMAKKLTPVGHSFQGNTRPSQIPLPISQTPRQSLPQLPLHVRTDGSYQLTSVNTNQPVHNSQTITQTVMQTISSSCSCTAEKFKDMYLFCTSVCNYLQQIQTQCNNLQQTLARAITNAEIEYTRKVSNLQLAKQAFKGKFDNLSVLGQQGIGICSNIQVIRLPSTKASQVSQQNQHRQRPDTSTSVQQSTDMVSPTQDHLEFRPQIHSSPIPKESSHIPSSSQEPPQHAIPINYLKPVSILKKPAGTLFRKVLPKKASTVTPSPILNQDPVPVEPIVNTNPVTSSHVSALNDVLASINNQIERPTYQHPQHKGTSANNIATKKPVYQADSTTDISSQQSAQQAILQVPALSTSSTQVMVPNNQSNTDFPQAEINQPKVSPPHSDDSTENPLICAFRMPYFTGDDEFKDTPHQKPAIKSVRDMVMDIENKCNKSSLSTSSRTYTMLETTTVKTSLLPSTIPVQLVDNMARNPRDTSSTSSVNAQPGMQDLSTASSKNVQPDPPSNLYTLSAMNAQPNTRSDISITSKNAKQGTTSDISTTSQNAQPGTLSDKSTTSAMTAQSDTNIATVLDDISQNTEEMITMYVNKMLSKSSPNLLDASFNMAELGDIDFLELSSILEGHPNSQQPLEPSSNTTNNPPMKQNKNRTTVPVPNVSNLYGKQDNFAILDQIFRADIPSSDTDITTDLQGISRNQIITTCTTKTSKTPDSTNTTNSRNSINNFHTNRTITSSDTEISSSIIACSASSLVNTSYQSTNVQITNSKSMTDGAMNMNNKPNTVSNSSNHCKTQAKRISPIVTRQATRKRLFNSTTGLRNLDDIVPLDNQESARKYLKTCKSCDLLPDTTVCTSTSPMYQAKPCSPSTIAGYISDQYLGKEITDSFPAVNSRRNMKSFLDVQPFDLLGRVTVNKLTSLLNDSTQTHPFDPVSKKISTSALEKCNQQLPHLFGRDLAFQLYSLSDLHQYLWTGELDQEHLTAVKSATIEKFSITERIWEVNCFKHIRHSIKCMFGKSLSRPVYSQLLNNKIKI